MGSLPSTYARAREIFFTLKYQTQMGTLVVCAGVVRPGAAGLLIGIECSRVRDSAWMYLTSFATTRIGVELAAVEENYPTML